MNETTRMRVPHFDGEIIDSSQGKLIIRSPADHGDTISA